jgi:tRNA (guanosine-2'-O-)-methyltransferase
MDEDPKKLIQHLSGFITERRMELFEQVLNQRTNYITVVLEDIYQSHNASAVLRSCECFGVQDVHIIENKNEYRINPEVVIGANKWLNLTKYRGKEFNTPDAVSDLKARNYRIVATTTREASVPIEKFNINKGKFALFFGTELTGLTDEMLEEADECVRIPMAGFTDSLNISVSAAIILHYLTLKLHRSNVEWKLSENEKDQIMIRWLNKSIKHLRGESPESLSNID